MRPESDPTTCPNCSESVQPHWKICPICATPLTGLRCPQCGKPVKERWKRCPECRAALICSTCGGRFPDGRAECPFCRPERFEEMERLVEPVTGMEFVRVPGGTFSMGDTFGDGIENELPVHEVQLDTFYLGRYPVTQWQWNRLMPANPARFRGDRLPVEQLAWEDVLAFIGKLTEASPDGKRFRLPTEAEWEYAARSGGKNQRYAGGNHLDSVAWFGENSGGQTHPVGSKAPNELDIFDMSGNVWEWCLDRFAEDAYRRHAAANPIETGDADDRVIRGGSWNLDGWSARCTRRMGFAPEFSGPALGFRVVMEL